MRIHLLLTVTWIVWMCVEAALVLLPTLLDRIRGRGTTQDRGSVVVLLASVSAGFWIAGAVSHSLSGRLPGPPDVLVGAGVAIMWVGLALRVWAILVLGGLFRGIVTIQEDHRLVTAGPYRWLRHPSYTGALVASLGYGIGLGHWIGLAALLLSWFAGLAYRIHVEESALRRTFGRAYDDYRARTRRLIPYVY
jgi:protein-S-isoprenylcysteine O-methyltransferase Ste14